MLSIYPTLIELCGLPPYEQNEGKSLVPIMMYDKAEEDTYALTTFGMNNHGVRTDRFRYIQYEDQGEELYDHSIDPHEWTNLAKQSAYSDTIEELKMYLPSKNAKWDSHSYINFSPTL